MRAFSLVTLSPEAFDDFSAHHADGNFQQTSAAGRLRAGQGIEVEYNTLAFKKTAKSLRERCSKRIAAVFPLSVWCTTAPCAIITITN